MAQRAARRHRVQQCTRVHHADILANPLGRAVILERETGRDLREPSCSRGGIFAHSLTLNRTLPFPARLPAFVRPQTAEADHSDHITSFARDESTGNLFGGVSVGGSSTCLLSVDSPPSCFLSMHLMADRADLGQLDMERKMKHITLCVL